MRIAINMASSIDGKIAPKKRGPVKLGSAFDSQRMAEIRALHDAVLNGSTTFWAHPYPLHVKKKNLVAKRLRQKKTAEPLSVVVSSLLHLPKNTPFARAKDAERWIFCGKKAPQKEQEYWRKQGVKIVVAPSLRPEPRFICQKLAQAGVKDLLLEGGGELNASFFEAGLVQRIFLTLCPVLLGGREAPSLFEGEGFKKAQKFRLEECRKVGQELYLIYKK